MSCRFITNCSYEFGINKYTCSREHEQMGRSSRRDTLRSLKQRSVGPQSQSSMLAENAPPRLLMNDNNNNRADELRLETNAPLPVIPRRPRFEVFFHFVVGTKIRGLCRITPGTQVHTETH